MAAIERYQSIIDVDYVGSSKIEAYLNDLRRLGAISEQTANRLRAAANSGLGGSSDELGRSLGVGAARIRDYDQAAQRMIATNAQAARGTANLRQEVQALDRAIETLESRRRFGSAPYEQPIAQVQNAVRRQLYSVLQASAVNQRVANLSDAGGQFTRLNEVGAGSARTPLALNSGAMNQQIADRLAAEREAAASAKRLAAQENRLEQILRRRASEGANTSATGLSYGPSGGIIGVQFERVLSDNTTRAQALGARIASLTHALSLEESASRISTTNRRLAASLAEEVNRNEYDARRTRALFDPTASVANVPDYEPTRNAVDYFRRGVFTSALLKEFDTPEHRGFATGQTDAGDPLKEYREQLRYGRELPVAGFTSSAKQMEALLAQQYGPRHQQIEDMKGWETRLQADDLGPIELDPSASTQRHLAQADAMVSLARRLEAVLAAANARPQALTSSLGQQPLALPAGSVSPLGRPIALGPGPLGLSQGASADGSFYFPSTGGPAGAPMPSRVAPTPPPPTPTPRYLAPLPPAPPGGAGTPPPPPPGGGTPPGGGSGSGVPSWAVDLERVLDSLRSTDPLEEKIKAARARLGVAGLALEDVETRGSVPLGSTMELDDGSTVRGYADESARAQAYLAARARVITAENTLAAAEERLSRGTDAATAARRRTEAAEARLREQITSAGGSGGGGGVYGGGSTTGGAGGFFGGFQRGFTGERNAAPYSEQLGQTFKFSVMYGTAYALLTAFTGTLAATVQEGIQFQQAVTQLKLATGDSSEGMEELARNVGQTSASYGFAPSQGVEAAARAVGLYGVADASEEDQARVGNVAADVVSRVALNSGMAPEDIQANIAAVTNAFGGGYEGAYRVADLDQYFSEKFGAAPGTSIQAVAEAGSVASSAGFNQAETSAIAALLQGRTGQTPSAVAGYMAQIFSRGGEGSLDALNERYGIDPNASLREQIYGLGEAYQGASGNEQNEIAAVFGRGKVQNAVTVLLDNLDEIDARVKDSGTEASGSSREAAKLRTEDIGGQIALTAGALKQLAGDLGESGLLNVIGVLVIGARELAEATSGILRLFTELPGPVRASIVALGLLAAAAKAGALSTGIGAATGLGGLTAQRTLLGRATGIQRAGVPFAAAAGLGSRVVVTPTGPIPLAGRAGAAAVAGNLARGAGALAGIAGPVGLAIIGLTAVGSLKSSVDRYTAASDAAASALAVSDLTDESTSEDYQARAAALTDQAANVDDTVGFTSDIMGESGDLKAQADELRARADAYAQVAEKLALDEAAAAAGEVVPAGITSFDPTVLSEQLGGMQASGDSAAQRLRALSEALDGTGRAARAAREEFDPLEFGSRLEDTLRLAVDENISGTSEVLDDKPGVTSPMTNEFGITEGGPVGNAPAPVIDYKDEISANLSTEALKAAVKERLDGRAIGELDTAEIEEFANEYLLSTIPEGVDPAKVEGVDEVRAALIDFLMGQQSAVREIIEAGGALTDTEVTNYINQVVANTEEALGNLQETDYSGRVKALARRVGKIADAQANNPTRQGGIELARIRRQLAEAQIAELENMRRAAQANARSRREVAAQGRKFLAQEISAAVLGGNQDALVNLITTAGAYAKQIALDAINAAIAAQRAAQAAFGSINELLGPFGGEVETGIDPALTSMRKALRQAVSAPRSEDPYLTGSDVPSVAQRFPSLEGGAGAESDRLTPAQEDAQRRLATLPSKAKIATAQAQLDSANADLDEEKRGTAGYYDALGRVRDAEEALAAAKKGGTDDAGAGEASSTAAQIAAARQAANVNPDDAVGAARAALASARADLAAAERGTVEYYNALGAVRAAQDSLQDTIVDRTSAIAEANAARVGGDMAAARASVVGARAALNAAARGTTEYFQALAGFYQAQDSMSDAVLAYRQNLRLLRIDQTNPLEVARAELAAAQAQLRADAGKAPDVRAEDRVAVQQAQAALEAQKFSQRLQTVQTADELGRISHQKYIRYLESEQRRLEQVKDRTFQQQQQLDEVEGLLKAAAEQMQGQWNFGDIRLPTPYQVRRYIESASGMDASRMAGSAVVQNTSQTTILINGADTAKVRQVVEEVVGKRARVMTSAPRRR